MTDPIIKMDTNGKATIISYNVPEPTSYAGRYIIELDFEESWFTPAAKKVPENRKKDKSDAQVTEAAENMAKYGVIDEAIFPNIKLSPNATMNLTKKS